MTSLKRVFLSIFAGFFVGNIGLIIGATFAPLLFPLSLNDPDRAPDLAVATMLALALLAGAGGFALCWRLCRRFVKPEF